MRTVTKRDLIDRVCDQRPHIRKTDVADIIAVFLDSIGESLTQDKRIELRDFGVFTPKERKARTARNPKTGAPVQVAATKVCGFKVGKELKLRLAASYKPSDE
jgi:integration host factor subunit beta